MSMTVVVTRDVDPRFRGFLASCMLEVAPGVYTSPRMSAGVRERVWGVVTDWFGTLGGGGVVMTWYDPALTGGQGIRILGSPPKELHWHDGIFLVRRPPQEPQAETSPKPE